MIMVTIISGDGSSGMVDQLIPALCVDIFFFCKYMSIYYYILLFYYISRAVRPMRCKCCFLGKRPTINRTTNILLIMNIPKTCRKFAGTYLDVASDEVSRP